MGAQETLLLVGRYLAPASRCRGSRWTRNFGLQYHILPATDLRRRVPFARAGGRLASRSRSSLDARSAWNPGDGYPAKFAERSPNRAMCGRSRSPAFRCRSGGRRTDETALDSARQYGSDVRKPLRQRSPRAAVEEFVGRLAPYGCHAFRDGSPENALPTSGCCLSPMTSKSLMLPMPPPRPTEAAPTEGVPRTSIRSPGRAWMPSVKQVFENLWARRRPGGRSGPVGDVGSSG